MLMVDLDDSSHSGVLMAQVSGRWFYGHYQMINTRNDCVMLIAPSYIIIVIGVVVVFVVVVVDFFVTTNSQHCSNGNFSIHKYRRKIAATQRNVRQFRRYRYCHYE